MGHLPYRISGSRVDDSGRNEIKLQATGQRQRAHAIDARASDVEVSMGSPRPLSKLELLGSPEAQNVQQQAKLSSS
jgi:hypothetical protein